MTRIDPVDGAAAPEADLRALHLVESEADERTPGEPPRPVEEAIASYRTSGGTRRLRWLATEGDEAAGAGFLSIYGPALVIGYVLVRPPFRRRGIGTVLFETVVVAARAEGVASFFGEHVSPAGAAFARSVGAVDDQRHLLAVLDLSAAELPAPTGIELRSWVGYAPDGLVESLVRARNAMADAPVPGGGAMPAWTVESQRDDEQRCVERGVPQWTTVALEGGEVVALTGVRVPNARPAPVAHTDDTATVPAARGRGLAVVVKRANLAWVRAERPDVERVMTRNAEGNAAILAVNRRLGFLPCVTLTTAVVTP